MKEPMQAFDGLTLGQRLKKLRTESGKTQQAISFSTEIPTNDISRWEHDQSAPQLRHFASLADHFGVSMDYLFWGVERQP